MITRRSLLQTTGCGFGYLAFAALANETAARDGKGNPLAPKPTHFPAKARRVIFLCMEGGPSHVDLFDPKPKLQELAGQPLPDSMRPKFTADYGSASSGGAPHFDRQSSVRPMLIWCGVARVARSLLATRGLLIGGATRSSRCAAW